METNHRVRFTLAIAMLGLLAACDPSQDDSGTLLSAPTLYPAFSLTQEDYVIRCDQDTLTVRRADALDVKGGSSSQVAAGVYAVQLMDNKSAEVLKDGKTYSVRCLPKGFPKLTATVNSSSESKLFVADFPLGGKQQRAVIFDARGTPIWWREFGIDPRALKVLADGQILAMNNTVGCSPTPGNLSYCATFRSYNPKTGQERIVTNTALALDVHDIQVTPTGTYLGVRYVRRNCASSVVPCQLASDSGIAADANIIDAEVIEFDPASGNVVFRWQSATEGLERFYEPRFNTYNAFNDLGLSNQPYGDARVTYADGTVAWDLFHINSVDQRGDKLLVSLRHMDTLLQISKTTGLVEWKLGGKAWEGRSVTLQPSAAMPNPNSETFLGGSHDARWLSDTDITVYDNGSGQSRMGRALRVSIGGGTANVTEAMTRNPGLKSVCCGSARRTGGDWVVSWGGTNTVGVYNVDGSARLELSVDLTTASGAIGFSYQFVPIATGTLDRSVLRMDMNR